MTFVYIILAAFVLFIYSLCRAAAQGDAQEDAYRMTAARRRELIKDRLVLPTGNRWRS